MSNTHSYNGSHSIPSFSNPTYLNIIESMMCNVLIKTNSATFDLSYWDSKRQNTQTILALHNAPGDLTDFRFLFTKLSSLNFRVLVPALPGSCDTNFHNGSYNETTEEKAEIIISFLEALDIKKIDIIVAYGLGSTVAYYLGASHNIFSSIISINGIGLRPHKGIRPYWIVNFLAKLTKLKYGIFFFKWFFKLFFYMKGYKKMNISKMKSALIAFSKLNFFQIESNLNELISKNLPILIIFSTNSAQIEELIGREVLEIIGCHRSNVLIVDFNDLIIHQSTSISHLSLSRLPGSVIDSNSYPKGLICKEAGTKIHHKHCVVYATFFLMLADHVDEGRQTSRSGINRVIK